MMLRKSCGAQRTALDPPANQQRDRNADQSQIQLKCKEARRFMERLQGMSGHLHHHDYGQQHKICAEPCTDQVSDRQQQHDEHVFRHTLLRQAADARKLRLCIA